MGMSQLGDCLGFTFKTGNIIGLGPEWGSDDLDGGRAFKAHIKAAINTGHASLSQESLQAVFIQLLFEQLLGQFRITHNLLPSFSSRVSRFARVMRRKSRTNWFKPET